MRIRPWGMFAVAALWLSASAASAQSKERVLSTRTVRSGATFELTVDLAPPHYLTLSVNGGAHGNGGVEHFTSTQIRQWLAGRPHGPSPESMLERSPSAGLGERIKDVSAPLGDIKTGQTLFLSIGEEAGAATYAVVLRNAPLPLEKHEVRQFLRDIKRAAAVADSLAGKKG